MKFERIWLELSIFYEIWLRGSWLHLEDRSSHEKNWSLKVASFLDLLQEFIWIQLNFDFGLLRNEINQWIWSLIKALMKVIRETVTQGVIVLPP
jgi:hypothetical protein